MSAIKNKNITLRVSEDFANTLKDFAKKKYMSQSNLIEFLVRRKVERAEQEALVKPYTPTPAELESINRGLEDLKYGRIHTEEEVEKEIDGLLWE